MIDVDVYSIFKDLTNPIKSLIIEKEGLLDYFKIQKQKLEGKAKEYEGYDAIERYWRDLLGPNFAFGDRMELRKKLHPGDKVIFHNVLLTNWFPVVPGSQYVRSLFEESLDDVKIRMGAVRFETDGQTGNMLFSAHVIQPFVAHNEICKGIPVIINQGAYEAIRDLINDYGAAHVDQLRGTLLRIPKTIEDQQKMKYKKIGIENVEGLTRSPLALTVAGKSGVSHPGTPSPLLGTAWTIWYPHKKYDWHYFWTGDLDHGFRLDEAVKAIKSRRPANDIPLTDFDQIDVQFKAPF